MTKKKRKQKLYITDDNGKKRELKEDDIAMIDSELSSLSLQLGLFLDAGLVVSTAFDELININRQSEKIIYVILRNIDRECREKNLPVANELLLFSQKIKNKALMRFAGLIIDNRNKGSALAEKLENESVQMQSVRLSRARAKAKEAETKLCFPMMLLLISLVAVCSAPALLQM